MLKPIDENNNDLPPCYRAIASRGKENVKPHEPIVRLRGRAREENKLPKS
jgi:hypothetical protein